MRRRRAAAVVAVAAATAMVLAGCVRETGGTARDCPRNAPPSVSGARAQPAPVPAPGAAGRLKVGVAYDVGGRGDASFDDAAGAGLDRASEQLGMPTATETTAQPGEGGDASANRLRRLVAQGDDPVIAVGSPYAGAVRTVATENPRVRFAIVDDDTVTLPNVTPLVFAEEQGSFLVGAAAALTTTTCRVGFVGGADDAATRRYASGYVQGARAVAPTIQVDARYLAPAGDPAGSDDPAAGVAIARGEYDGGADIVFAVADGSDEGVFAAARTARAKAIGADSDRYDSPQLARYQQVILTSMIKRVDVAVYDYVAAVSTNDLPTLPKRFGLGSDGVGWSTSGGQVDDIAPQLDAYEAAVVSGRITVTSAG